ncbi:odorant receptor 43a isoform X2 [Halyomorpha halys]|uniref:odorant receptor 43a isoform X2 n=1 Tax=Halyomorpha halys TaxID=286706 RepID=UPI0006D518BB|nr:uncharacterized protein LOC106688856 isoform X1 [Halyomorpha halys]
MCARHQICSMRRNTISNSLLQLIDFCAIGIAGGCNVCGILVFIHHKRYSTRIHELTDTMDAICKQIMTSDLNKKDEFLKEYERNSKIMTALANYSFYLNFTTTCSYFLSLPAIEWYTGNYRANFPLAISNSFNDRIPGVYELIVLAIAGSTSISTATKSTYDCLFVSLLKIQTTFFKYLYETIDNLKGDVQSQHHFLEWIRLHQEIMKNNEELLQTFSPVVIIYYLLVINIVVCGAFVESKKENDHLIQSISVGSYVVVTILYYFLLSNAADELTNEAQKLTFAGYALPWYQMKKRNTSMIKLILTMSNKSIEITAYKAPVFLLNREMFVGFMVAALSAFLTFCKMGGS